METEMNLRSVWNKVVERVKLKVIHPTFWKTVEAAVPIAAEDGVFVVGFGPMDYHLSGHMMVSEHKNAIEQALKEFTGAAYAVRVIEGSSLDDWLVAKDKDERSRALKAATYEKEKTDTGITKAWESLLETAGRRYAALHLRQLPQFRAGYIADMLKRMSDTMDQLMPEEKETDELSHRALARVIERVATLAEVPPATIALELLRFRAAKKAQ